MKIYTIMLVALLSLSSISFASAAVDASNLEEGQAYQYVEPFVYEASTTDGLQEEIYRLDQGFSYHFKQGGNTYAMQLVETGTNEHVVMLNGQKFVIDRSHHNFITVPGFSARVTPLFHVGSHAGNGAVFLDTVVFEDVLFDDEFTVTKDQRTMVEHNDWLYTFTVVEGVGGSAQLRVQYESGFESYGSAKRVPLETSTFTFWGNTISIGEVKDSAAQVKFGRFPAKQIPLQEAQVNNVQPVARSPSVSSASTTTVIPRDTPSPEFTFEGEQTGQGAVLYITHNKDRNIVLTSVELNSGEVVVPVNAYLEQGATTRVEVQLKEQCGVETQVRLDWRDVATGATYRYDGAPSDSTVVFDCAGENTPTRVITQDTPVVGEVVPYYRPETNMPNPESDMPFTEEVTDGVSTGDIGGQPAEQVAEITESEVTVPVAQRSAPLAIAEDCDGCQVEGRCLPEGTSFNQNGQEVVCRSGNVQPAQQNLLSWIVSWFN